MTDQRLSPGRSARSDPAPVSPPAARSIRGRRLPEGRDDRRTVRTTGLLVLVLTAGAYLPGPLYPDYQRLFGYDDLVMTLLFATFALVSGPTLLLCGPAADVVGPRPVLRSSVLLAAVGSGCFLLALGPAWLFAGRVSQALALGAATGAAQALITRHRHPTARIGGPLLAGLAFAAGTAAGPALSGVLAQYAPAPLVTPYLLHLALLAWVWHLMRRNIPEPGPGASGARRRWRPARPHLPSALRPLFVVAGLTGFLAWAVVGIYLALLPALLARTSRGAGPALAGGVVAAVLVCSVLTQCAGIRRSARSARALGLAALTASLVLLAASGAASLHATLVSALLAGSGHGLAVSGAARAVDARTPPGHRAGIAAALYLLFYTGSGTPAVAVGLMSAHMPLTAAVTVLSWAGAALGAVVLCSTCRLPVPVRRDGRATHSAAHVPRRVFLSSRPARGTGTSAPVRLRGRRPRPSPRSSVGPADVRPPGRRPVPPGPHRPTAQEHPSGTWRNR
ncbi:MFS transporter [Streptomyces sp. NPDC006990]|uniref:MFS transporter n=1 Tax=unclassified Streptomyces TaxID=2593676 RepID=UPI003451D77B